MLPLGDIVVHRIIRPIDTRKRPGARARARRGLIFQTVVLALCFTSSVLWADEERAWQALRNGQAIAIMRHALAPGTGDPPDFQLSQCTTQRNLSAQGRTQAEEIGGLFRRNGISVERVYSSQWCRCLETARLLGLGKVEALPALNSFFSAPERRDTQMRALRAWLANLTLREAVLLVTHQVVITALTGIFPASGEVVVLGRLPNGQVEVIGQIPPP